MTDDDLELGPDEVEATRSNMYRFFASLLWNPPDADLLSKISELEGDDMPLGRAVAVAGRVASTITENSAEREYNKLFVGVGRGELLPYASYYLTGFLHEKPLAVLRRDMRKLGISRAESINEPEDHIASLCEMMAGLIDGSYGQKAELVTQQAFFETHIGGWFEHFFSDLENAQSSVFYSAIGSAGLAFMTVEKEAFRLSGLVRAGVA